MSKVLTVFKLLVIACTGVFVKCKQPLYVGALVELTNNWYEDYVNFFVTMWEHVFEEIDNRTDILADYTLQLIIKDTEVKVFRDTCSMFGVFV